MSKKIKSIYFLSICLPSTLGLFITKSRKKKKNQHCIHLQKKSYICFTSGSIKDLNPAQRRPVQWTRPHILKLYFWNNLIYCLLSCCLSVASLMTAAVDCLPSPWWDMATIRARSELQNFGGLSQTWKKPLFVNSEILVEFWWKKLAKWKQI